MSAHLVFDLEELRERADEVNPIDSADTVAAIKAKLNKYKELIALCGPQVGKKERVIGLKFKDGVIKFYINPKIVKSSGLHLVRERDVSVGDKEFICPRPSKITIQYQTETAKPEQNILEGAAAEIFDRMQNYLDGITLEDFGLEILDGFDEASEEEKAQIIDMYLESLKKRETLVNEAIETDKDAKELKDAISFMESVDSGETVLGDMSLIIKHDND